MKKKTEHYDYEYFQKFKKTSLLHQRFIHLVDRKEPLYSFLKRQFPPHSKLLDVGCGNGNFLYPASQYFDCTGVDISTDAIAWCKKQAPNAKLLTGSAYDLSHFPPHSFDIVCCFDTFEHLLDTQRAAQQMNRVLKPQGVLVISAPNADCFSKSLKYRQWFGFKDPSHLWFLSAREWGRRLEDSGFVPMKTWYSGLIDPPYIPLLPHIFQEIIFKYFTQGLSLLGFPIPSKLGEVFFMVLIKNPGFNSTFYKDQQKLLKAI